MAKLTKMQKTERRCKRILETEAKEKRDRDIGRG